MSSNATPHGISTATARLMSGRDYARELVRTRDDYTCQGCRKVWHPTMRRFDVHHLDGKCGKFSKSVDRTTALDRLTTLCHRCHYNHPSHSKTGKWSKAREKYQTVQKMHAEGFSYKEIGDKFNISDARIYQIVTLDSRTS